MAKIPRFNAQFIQGRREDVASELIPEMPYHKLIRIESICVIVAEAAPDY